MSEEARPTLDADRLVDVFDRVSVCVYVRDLDGRYLYMNRICAELLGGEPVPEDAVAEWRAQDLLVFERGGALDFEDLVHGRTFQTHKVPLFDPDGRAVAVIGVSTEVTDRKRHEEELRRSEARLTEAQQIAGIGSWHMDTETREVTWSPELRRIFGLEADEAPSGADAMRLVHPDDHEALTTAAITALNGEAPLNLDLRIVRPNGDQRIVHCRAEVTLGPDGVTRRLDGTCSDVTDRRRAEARLADAQRLAQIGSWDHDIDAGEVTWSGEMYRIYGVDPEHFVPTRETVLEMLVPEDRDRLVDIVSDAVSSGGAFDMLVQARRPSGEIRELRIRGAVHSPPGNGPSHLIGIAQDLTDIRRNQLALAEADELFRSTFERAPVGMALVDARGGFVLVNDALCELLGRSQEALLRSTVADVTHPEDLPATSEARRRLMAGELDEWVVENRYVTPDGSVRWGALKASMLHDADGRPEHSLVILQDITEHRQAERRRAAVHEVASVMAGGAPLSDAVPALVEAIATAMGWAQGAAWLLDTGSGRLRREGSLPANGVGEHTCGRGEGLPGQVWDEGAAVAGEAGLCFPVISDCDVLGVLEFHGEGTDHLDDDVVALIESFGRQIGEFLVRKRGEELLMHQALHDPLTGLPNRVLFFDRLDLAMRRQRRKSSPLAVLFVDFDGFKAVNDRFGHEGGDEVLRRAAERVASALRAEDTVARFGGDELVVLSEHVGLPGAAARVAERIIAALRAPLDVRGEQVTVSASIGICVAEEPLDTREELLRQADVAMYRAKAGGPGRYVIAS